MRLRLIAVSLATLAVPVLAAAAETVTYTYDAQGRLVRVDRSGTVNDNVDDQYTYDDADNRTKKQVTGAPGKGISKASAGRRRWGEEPGRD